MFWSCSSPSSNSSWCGCQIWVSCVEEELSWIRKWLYQRACLPGKWWWLAGLPAVWFVVTFPLLACLELSELANAGEASGAALDLFHLVLSPNYDFNNTVSLSHSRKDSWRNDNTPVIYEIWNIRKFTGQQLQKHWPVLAWYFLVVNLWCLVEVMSPHHVSTPVRQNNLE